MMLPLPLVYVSAESQAPKLSNIAERQARRMHRRE